MEEKIHDNSMRLYTLESDGGAFWWRRIDVPEDCRDQNQVKAKLIGKKETGKYMICTLGVHIFTITEEKMYVAKDAEML